MPHPPSAHRNQLRGDATRLSVEVGGDDESALPRRLGGARPVVGSCPAHRLSGRHPGHPSQQGDRGPGSADPSAARNLDALLRGPLIGVPKHGQSLRPVPGHTEVRPLNPHRRPRGRGVPPPGQVDAELRYRVLHRRTRTQTATTDPAAVGQDHQSVGAVTPRAHAPNHQLPARHGQTQFPGSPRSVSRSSWVTGGTRAARVRTGRKRDRWSGRRRTTLVGCRRSSRT